MITRNHAPRIVSLRGIFRFGRSEFF